MLTLGKERQQVNMPQANTLHTRQLEIMINAALMFSRSLDTYLPICGSGEELLLSLAPEPT